MPADSFPAIRGPLLAGDADAARTVFERFAHRLIGLAHQRLDQRLRGKVDPEDVVQSVYKSLFRRIAQGQVQLESWGSLWGLLTLITIRKCGRWSEHFHAGIRDIDREVVPSAGDGSGSSWQALDREPTPAEVVLLDETVEQLLRGLTERDAAIVARSLQGYTAAEVSDQLNLTTRTVYRMLERIKKRLERLRAGDGEAG